MTLHGQILPDQNLDSRHLDGRRTFRVYLPPSYEREPRRRFPVLYLHDGQNVFSSAGPECCYGWGNWQLDRTVDRLVGEKRMREIIMVAVDNGRSRYREYRGRLHPRERPARGKSGRTRAGDLDNERFEAYARFLMKELKPRVDREFRTLKTAASTGLMGSSLGGLCSFSLAWEFPKVFGRAASLSGSFQVEGCNFLEHVLRPFTGKPRLIRFYIDSGTMDDGDDDGRAITEAVTHELRRIGWKDGRSLLQHTELDVLSEPDLEWAGLPRHKWAEARKSQHNEFYWRLRVWRALEFLFPPQ